MLLFKYSFPRNESSCSFALSFTLCVFAPLSAFLTIQKTSYRMAQLNYKWERTNNFSS